MSKGKQMPFRLEHEMCAPTEKWLQSQGLMVKREFTTPWGICDLVACSINKTKAAKRIKLGQKRPVGSSFRVLLLNLIPDREDGKSITFDDLYQQFEDLLEQPRIQKELERLRKDKFIALTPDGAFQKINGWMPLHKKLIAVELKLDKVNEALNQAISNLELADESYVGLPSEIAKRVFYGKKKNDFEKEGVGILSIAPSACRMLKRAVSNPTRRNDFVQKHTVERFWRNYPINIVT